MRLLIVTQAVDIRDSNLGFFHRWIEEFAKHCERVIVVCLRKGEYALPKHVEVIALGEGIRAVRALELCSISFGRRGEYDAVFAHMSPEFVVAAGWLWRMMGKKVGLWYVHKSVTLWLRIAVMFVNRVFTASKESFRLPSSKVNVIGHGIDTDFFSPDKNIQRGNHLLSVGRLSKVKHHEVAIKAAKEQDRELLIAGEGPEKENLKVLADELGVKTTFLNGLTQVQLRDEYRRAKALVHASETGSVDKVVLEALACGLKVETSADVVRDIVAEGREGVVRNHSLPQLITHIMQSYV